MNAQPPPQPHLSRQPNPTPRTTGPRSRSTSTTASRVPIPPPAPKPSRDRRPIDHNTSGPSTRSNPLFNLPQQQQSIVPRASCGKPDDILAPPDAQSCPFAKAGLKVLGIGAGAYGELEGQLEWPVELYANERMTPWTPL